MGESSEDSDAVARVIPGALVCSNARTFEKSVENFENSNGEETPLVSAAPTASVQLTATARILALRRGEPMEATARVLAMRGFS